MLNNYVYKVLVHISYTRTIAPVNILLDYLTYSFKNITFPEYIIKLFFNVFHYYLVVAALLLVNFSLACVCV